MTLKITTGTIAPIEKANWVGGLRLLPLPLWPTNVAWAVNGGGGVLVGHCLGIMAALETRCWRFLYYPLSGF